MYQQNAYAEADRRECKRLARSEALRDVYDQLKSDPAKVAEADSYTAGAMSDSHYDSVERAMTLLGCAETAGERELALQRLVLLSKANATAREQKLWEMADEQLTWDEIGAGVEA